MNHQLGINYSKIINILKTKIEINELKVLDIGSGTGAWSAAYKNNGASKVLGVDFAKKMIIESKKNYPEIDFIIADAENLHQIKNNSFDIATASYVIHGVTKERRKKILSEMKRVSSKYIVLHDFVGKTPYYIRVLEFLERSDYKHFKQNICSELKEIFTEVESFEIDNGSGLYLCTI